jgi:DNA-binding GntR family transcriptional regulator
MPKTPSPPDNRSRKAVVPELAVRVHQHLRAAGAEPGFHVTAQVLASQFAVSRWTANEALAHLAEKGVVTHTANRGYYVSAAVSKDAAELGLIAARDLTPIYFRIAADLLNGSLKEQVSESYLRERYQLSAADLAALLHRIAREGWIERRSGYGWMFSPILRTPQMLEQSYQLRLLIEPAALLTPGFRLAPDVIARLRAAHEEIVAGAAATLPADVLYDRGVIFHETLAEASGNPFFLDTLRRINRLRRLLIYRSMVDRRRFYEQSAQHLEILDLLAQGRNPDAARALTLHLESVIRKVPPQVAAGNDAWNMAEGAAD